MSDQTTTINTLKTAVHQFRSQRGWLTTDQKDIAISITLEAAELLEHFQWVNTKDVEAKSSWRHAVGEEMVDILFLLLEMAHEFDIDVSQAFYQKLEKQAQKYPLSDFNPSQDEAAQIRAYYRVKAKTRTDHPFAQEVLKDET